MLSDNSQFIAKMNKCLNEQKNNLFIGNDQNSMCGLDYTSNDKKDLFSINLEFVILNDINRFFPTDSMMEKERNDILSTLDRKIESKEKLGEICGLVNGRKEIFVNFKPNFLVKFGIWIGMPSQRKNFDQIFCTFFPMINSSKSEDQIYYILYYCRDNRIFIVKKHQFGGSPTLSCDSMMLPVESKVFFSALLKEASVKELS